MHCIVPVVLCNSYMSYQAYCFPSTLINPCTLLADCCIVLLHDVHFSQWDAQPSVINGSGPSLRVPVWVATGPEPDWQYGLSINPNCRFRYTLIDISLPLLIGRVLHGLYSGSIWKYIYHGFLYYLMIVLDQDRLFDIEKSHFACYVSCEINNILSLVSLLMICIFDHWGGQWFNYMLKYPCNAFITPSASPAIDEPSLKLGWRILSKWRCDHVTFSFTHTGWQYIGYGFQGANNLPITLFTRSKMVEGPLTLEV